MRVIVLTHGGAEPLLDRLAEERGITVSGVFVETDLVRRRSLAERIRRSVRYYGLGATMAKLARLVLPARRKQAGSEDAGASIEAHAERYGMPVHRVSRYGDPASLALMAAAQPDLGITWGTGILAPAVFELPSLGTINFHQGHTPYYRGGPSVFWELFNGELQVGLTIHHVAAAVDAGDVVLQELVPLTYDYDRFGTRFEAFLDEFRMTLRARGAELLVEALRRIADGTAARQRQDISLGRRYKLPTRAEQDELRRRLRARVAQPRRPDALRGAHVGRS
jgi:methionyl-tRNA formyltransferase